MGKNFLLGLLFGAAVGAGVGLLLAPRPGVEMREQIVDTSKAAASRIGKAASSVVHRGQEEEIKQAI